MKTPLVTILAGKLFDSENAVLLRNQAITISTEYGEIVEVRTFDPQSPLSGGIQGDTTIDLRHLTVLPGFVDAHVHMFLHSYEYASWDDQLTKETVAERSIRAAIHAKKNLLAGYTTVRDLGTEGAEDADLALRKCLSGPKPLIRGPRYFCANRAIVATGAYGPRSQIRLNTNGIEGVSGGEVADGEVECAKAVRRQISAGADWIKIYADYKTRPRMNQVAPSIGFSAINTFTPSELSTMISTAHRLGVKVAAHAVNPKTIQTLLDLGIDSIEHGHLLCKSPSLIRNWSHSTRETWLVPTLSVYYKVAQWLPDHIPTQETWKDTCRSFQMVVQEGLNAPGGGINIAVGGDTGAIEHGENALEMKLMVRLGARWNQVLQWGTLNGWRCIRPILDPQTEHIPFSQLGDNEVKFGCIKKGWAADIIAVGGDLDKDFENTVDNVQFVMKAGKIHKIDGKETPFD